MSDAEYLFRIKIFLQNFMKESEVVVFCKKSKTKTSRTSQPRDVLSSLITDAEGEEIRYILRLRFKEQQWTLTD